MCGLVGMAGMLEYKHKQAMRDLLFLNSLRGKDSTGLSAVSRERFVTTKKLTVPSYEFLEYPLVDRSMKHADQVWIGHSRYRTVGEVSKANAQPFEVLDDNGDILLVGAHNGTLQNAHEVERILNDKFETDSEALFNLLVEADDFKTAINSLRGAWSLVWWDPTTDSVHFCRNKERPLTYAYTKDGKVLVWASEAWMIINACRRNGIELLQNEKGLSCYSTNDNNLYTLAIPQEKDQVLPDLVKEGGYTGLPERTFQKNFDWRKPWYGQQEAGEEEKESEKKKVETTGYNAKNVVTLGYPPVEEGSMKGFNGVNLSRKQVADIRAKGCAWCHDKLDTNIIVGFLAEDAVVCVRCMRDTHPKLDRDPLDDDIDGVFDVVPDSPEYKKLIKQSLPIRQS